MMRTLPVLVAVVLVASAVVWQRTRREAGELAAWDMADDVQQAASDALVKVGGLVGVEAWRAPAKYAGTIAAAEAANGIPAGMLERLLWQESRYREDIIAGRVKSRVGALGIAQFMPATAAELGVDPLDPVQAINGAARYLKKMYGQFGDWQKALAAYNWGPGNVRNKGLAAAPAETRAYWRNILAAVGMPETVVV